MLAVRKLPKALATFIGVAPDTNMPVELDSLDI